MILDALPRIASTTRIVLASASPRRAELLKQLGIKNFDVKPSSFEENLPKANLDGARYAELTARAKAADIAKLVQREIDEVEEEGQEEEGSKRRVLVIGADTVVEVEGKILEKPAEDDGGREGREMLRRLSGREHKVSTGVSLVLIRRRRSRRRKRRSEGEGTSDDDDDDGDRVLSKSFSETTLVRFAALPESEIAAYVSSGEGRGKAGGYGIQGSAAAFVKGISGCVFNVVGLPLHAVSRELDELLREGGEED